MEIGTIGAGDFAQAFAKRALKAGHKVKLSNNRVVLTLHAIARYNVAFLVTRLKKTGGESGIRS
jgi:3-hydroxyisobutyrate dehydrogenase-like beta-hydroxyacid dehydrogenase